MEELLPALPHDRRRGKAQRRDCQFWGIRTPLSASWVVDGNRRRRGRVIEIISVVLQFNDLWLRRGWSQRNVRRFTRIFGKLSGGNVGPRSTTSAILFLRSSKRQHARRNLARAAHGLENSNFT